MMSTFISLIIILCPFHFALSLVPTSAPLGLRAVATGSHSLLLTWEPPPLEHRNGRIREYKVKLEEIETGDILELASASTQVNVSNLHPFYNYKCSVAAETIGVGPFSEDIRVQTDEYSKSVAFYFIFLPRSPFHRSE